MHKKDTFYTTEEIKRVLSVIKSLRNKSLILFLSSSGIRRGSIPNISMKYLKQIPYDCLDVTVYADEPDEYVHSSTKNMLYYMLNLGKDECFCS